MIGASLEPFYGGSSGAAGGASTPCVVHRPLLLGAVALLLACSNTKPSGDPSISAKPDVRSAAVASSSVASPATVPALVASVSADAAAPSAPHLCGGLADKFEPIGELKGDTTIALLGPKKQDELPAPLAWGTCARSASAPPSRDCSELRIPSNGEISPEVRDVSVDNDAPGGALLAFGVATADCTLVLSVRPNGTVLTALAARSAVGGVGLTAASGGVLVANGGAHQGETERTYHFTFVGSSTLLPPPSANVEGSGFNDFQLSRLVSDKLWVGSDGFAALGSVSPLQKIAHGWSAVVLGEHVVFRDATQIGVTAWHGEDAVVYTVPSGHRILNLAGNHSAIAWIELTQSACELHTSPFPQKPGEFHDRLVDRFSCQTDWFAKNPHPSLLVGPDHVYFERFPTMANDPDNPQSMTLYRLSDGHHWSLASALCPNSKRKCSTLVAPVGITSDALYLHVQSLDRLPLTSLGDGAAPESLPSDGKTDPGSDAPAASASATAPQAPPK